MDERSEASPRRRVRRAEPITVDRIIDIALGIVQTQGFDALTMRRVASVLETGPASLYVHVENKAALDDLMIGRLSAEIRVPEPDPARWREQAIDVCSQLRDQYLRYPGIARAAMAVVPTDLDTLRISEGLLSILLSADPDLQAAAWTLDTLALYVAAYSLEISVVRARVQFAEKAWVLDQQQLIDHLTALPAASFPSTRRLAYELTNGRGHERFDFTIGLLLGALAR